MARQNCVIEVVRGTLATLLALPPSICGSCGIESGRSKTGGRGQTTAACAYRIRPNTPRFSSTSRVRTSVGRRRRSRTCSAASSRTFSCNRRRPGPTFIYQTAFVDNAGKLQIRRDVYNLDSRTLAAIKSERGIIETAPERKQEQEIASGSGPNRSARPAHTSATFQSMFYEPPSYARPTTGLIYR
jgi:hypothetical protein